MVRTCLCSCSTVVYIFIIRSQIIDYLFITVFPPLAISDSLTYINLNVVFTDFNKEVLVQCGVLDPLIELLHSKNPEVQCNACGCISSLATNGKYSEVYRYNSYIGWEGNVLRSQGSFQIILNTNVQERAKSIHDNVDVMSNIYWIVRNTICVRKKYIFS